MQSKTNLLTILAMQETNQRRFHALIFATSVTPDTELTCFFFIFFFLFFSFLLFSDVLLLKMRVQGVFRFNGNESKSTLWAHIIVKMIKILCVIKCVH